MQFTPILAVKTFFSRGGREVTTAEIKVLKESMDAAEWTEFAAQCQQALAASSSSEEVKADAAQSNAQ